MIHEFETTILKTFVTVSETKNFSAAAQMLHRTQPAVSQQIKKLEENVKRKLFARGGNTVELTAEGEMLLKFAREIVALSETARHCMAMQLPTEQISVGAPDDYLHGFLQGPLTALAMEHPDVCVSVTCGNSSDLVHKWERGEIDMCIVATDPDRDLGTTLHVDELVWTASDRKLDHLKASQIEWKQHVLSYTSSFWTMLIICFPIASFFQWYMTYFVSFKTKNVQDYSIDWGLIGVLQPEHISEGKSLFLTGAAYLYMGICTYLFFSGLIFFHAISSDLSRTFRLSHCKQDIEYQQKTRAICQTLLKVIFRCSVLGLLMCITMKVQTTYLQSDAPHILSWLLADLMSLVWDKNHTSVQIEFGVPTNLTSYLVALAICAVFGYCSQKIHAVWKLVKTPPSEQNKYNQLYLWRMGSVLVFLLCAYLLVGVTSGFTILLMIGLVVAICSIISPSLTFQRERLTTNVL